MKTINQIMDSLPTRLHNGTFYCGPDFYNCFNTGTQPAILKSATFHHFPSLADGYKFAVGPALQLTLAIKRKVNGRSSHKSKDVERCHTVYFYKTAKAAKEKFRQLCEERLEQNEKARAEHEDAIKRSKSKDMNTAIGGALDAADY